LDAHLIVKSESKINCFQKCRHASEMTGEVTGSSMMGIRAERAQTVPGCTWTKIALSKTAWYLRVIRLSSRRHYYP